MRATIKSPIRYVGGKAWLAAQLSQEIEAVSPKLYFEPFLGGAAVALNVPSYIPRVLSDTNATVMDLWRCICKMPSALIEELARVESAYGNDQAGYLNARGEMNRMIHDARPIWVRRAAVFLYLNARCFNGLWRTNASGAFNVPWGKIEKPSSIDLDEARALSLVLRGATFSTGDYWTVLYLHRLKLRGAAIYCDPPYDATFGDYTKDGFDEVDQRELAERLRWCVTQGAKVWATNSDTPLVREIYSWAKIEPIDEYHSVGATGARRGSRSCLLIRGGS